MTWYPIRKAVVIVACVFAMVWAFGTAVALGGASFEPGQCRLPYRAWALTWPVWFVAPTSALEWVQKKALEACP